MTSFVHRTDMMTSQESLRFPAVTWGAEKPVGMETLWWALFQEQQQWPPSDSSTTWNRIRFMAWVAKASQRWKDQWPYIRLPVSQSLLGAVMSGTGASGYNTHTHTSRLEQGLHLLNSASSPTTQKLPHNTQHINAKLSPPTPPFILLSPSFFLLIFSKQLVPDKHSQGGKKKKKSFIHFMDLWIYSGLFKHCDCRINIIDMMAKLISNRYHKECRKNTGKHWKVF